MNFASHRRKLAILILLALANTFCATVDRGANRTTVKVNGELAYPRKETYGCDDHQVQQHRQMGGEVSVSYEHRKGFVAQADAAGAYGERICSNFAPAKESYAIGMVGGKLGFDGKYVGFDVGGRIVTDGESFLAAPRLNLRAGNLNVFWVEVGTDVAGDPLGAISPLGGGLAFRTKYVSGAVGGMLHLRPLVDLFPDTYGLAYGSFEGDNTGGAYARLSFALGEHFGLHLGGILARDPSVHAGLSWSF